MHGFSNRSNIAEDKNGKLKCRFEETTQNRAQRKYEREAKRYKLQYTKA